MNEKISAAKTDRLTEIEASREYGKVYSYYKKNLFGNIVFSLLGSEPYEMRDDPHTKRQISDFCYGLTLNQLIHIANGNSDIIDDFIEEVIFSNGFIRTEIIYDKIIKEAHEYVKAGVFNERELALIEFLEKTKASGAKRFTAYLISGRKLKCRNEVSSSGTLREVGDSFYQFDFDRIDRVEYKKKIIYQNKNIKKIKGKIIRVHTKKGMTI